MYVTANLRKYRTMTPNIASMSSCVCPTGKKQTVTLWKCPRATSQARNPASKADEWVTDPDLLLLVDRAAECGLGACNIAGVAGDWLILWAPGLGLVLGGAVAGNWLFCVRSSAALACMKLPPLASIQLIPALAFTQRRHPAGSALHNGLGVGSWQVFRAFWARCFVTVVVATVRVLDGTG